MVCQSTVLIRILTEFVDNNNVAKRTAIYRVVNEFEGEVSLSKSSYSLIRKSTPELGISKKCMRIKILSCTKFGLLLNTLIFMEKSYSGFRRILILTVQFSANENTQLTP